MHQNSRVLSAATVIVAVAALIGGSAQRSAAFPPFVQKEGKPCAYCHVKAEGGGKRNYRGLYYKAHELKFTEFDDDAEAKKVGEPVAPDPDPKTMPKSWTALKAAAPAPVPEMKAMSVTEAQAKSKAAYAAYKKNPKDAKAKKNLSVTVADLGRATMLDQSIPPKKRYPDALKLYKQALTLDPTNKTALDDKKQIEAVYKSMGKPVPQ